MNLSKGHVDLAFALFFLLNAVAAALNVHIIHNSFGDHVNLRNLFEFVSGLMIIFNLYAIWKFYIKGLFTKSK